MSRIDLNIVATGNFSQVEAQLARLKAQAAALNTTIAGMSVFSPQATADMRSALGLFETTLRNTGMFQTQMVNLRSETEKFGNSLQRGNVKLGESFRLTTAHIRNQQSAITKLAREQVRLMNSTTVSMGDGRQMVVTPRGIDEAINKQQILNQEYRIFRQVVANGSTQLINWGKNTQWAGRQLTVGLTVPLTIFGATASRMFMEADKQLTRLAKVYGDASKGMVDQTELQAIRGETLKLAQEIASTMGVAVEETIGIAADLAATGKQGNELLESTSEAMRLAVLGEVDRQEAMQATLSIQSVFKQDTKELADSINFLNAVENQTSTSLNDLTVGIVKAGPVVQGLGGEIKDLALMMVAMREGGIPASEAANAIKSSLASLINPTKQTREVLNGFGIDLVGIVDKNAGDVTGTLVDLQAELSKLDDLSRQRVIEQIFGKFQFSRINALLNNLGRAGSQTEEVLKISGMSVQQLAQTAEQELTTLTNSASMRFVRAFESFKANLIPIGETFTEVGTLLLNVANKVIEVFNNLPEPVKNFINAIMLVTAVAGPLIMITGVLGNFFGYIVKGVSTFMALKQAGRGVFEHFTPESVAARQSAELLESAIFDETKAINVLNAAMEKLNNTLAEMRNNSTAAAGSMSAMSASTMAAAEGAALAASGRTAQLYKSGKSFTYQGGELSHLTPESLLKNIFNENELRVLMSPGTLLGAGDLAAKQFQQKIAGKDFAAQGYYDPSMGSREQALLAMAPEASRSYASDLISQMSAESMARLYPTMEEHTAEIAKYQIALEKLFEQDNASIKKVAKDIETKIASGDLEGAAAVLRKSIDMTDEQLEQLIASRAQEYRDEFNRIYQRSISEGLDPSEARVIAAQEMQIAATTRESEVYKDAIASGRLADTGFGNLGSTDARRQSGMAIAALSGTLPMAEQLNAATQRRIKAMEVLTRAEQKLAAQQEIYKNISNEELLSKRKYIRGQEIQNAYVDKQNRIYAKIGNQWYLLSTKNGQQIVQSQDLINALEMRESSERQVELANRLVANADNAEARASQQAAQADIQEANSSKVAAAADIKEAAASNQAARGGIMGRMGRMGNVGIGALGMLGSGASMLIPTGQEDTPLSQGMNVLSNVGMGASMGMMLGPKGAAVGAVVGLGVSIFQMFNDNAEKAAAELEAFRMATEAATGKLLDAEQQLLGTDTKELKDIPLEAFGTKTEEAQSKLEQFTQALTDAANAEEDSVQKSRVNEIKGMQSADELISSSMFQRMIFEAIAGGANKEDISLMLEGYLDVADKEYFADRVKQYLDQTIPDDADANQIASEYINGLLSANDKIVAEAMQGGTPKVGTALGRMIQETRDFEELRAGRSIGFNGQENASMFDIISGLQQNASVMGAFESGDLNQLLNSYFTGQVSDDQLARGEVPTGTGGTAAAAYGAVQSALTINGEAADPATIMQILSALQGITSLEPNVQNLSGAMGDFQQNVTDTANSLTSLLANGTDLQGFEQQLQGINLDNVDPAVITEISSQLNNMGDQGPEVASFFDGLIDSGVSLEVALKAVRLLLSGTMTDVDELKALAQDEILFNIRYQEFYSGTPGGVYRPSGITDLEMPDSSSLVSAARESMSGGGGGGGGSADTSAIEEFYDKQIKQQDKVIENIKKEREERQKLLDLQQRSLDFALKEQDLKNQIARAQAEGDFAQAALLQAQLDAETAMKDREDAERKRQEKEDRQIKAAEREKKRLERQKQEAVDAASGGGGGGGGGGPSEQELKRIEQRVKYLQGVLRQSLIKFSKDIEGQVLKDGLGGFFDSKPVKEFRDEMVALGVPIEEVNEYLDTVFDGFIQQTNLVNTKHFKDVEKGLQDIGFEGEQLQDVLPNAFAIIQDDNLTSTEKIDEIAKAFEDSGMDADEAKIKARNFYKEVGKGAEISNIDAIASAWARAGDSAARTAALQALANDVVTSNLSPDVVEGRLASINEMYPPGAATGGYIIGPGTSTSDSIPVRLSNGEYVIRASSVDKYGVPFFEALNKGVMPMMAKGGMVSRYPEVAARMAMGGYVRYRDGGLVSNSRESEYNITVNVTKSNASADEIAGEVVRVLQRRERMNKSVIRV